MVWVVCVQPPGLARAGKIELAGPLPPSLTAFCNWKFPAAAPR